MALNEDYIQTHLDKTITWIKSVLHERRVSEVISWRMLEYWLQVELFRSLNRLIFDDFKAEGTYEIPYVTSYSPRNREKIGVKWSDLLAINRKESLAIWFELKDLGRSVNRLEYNAKGVGKDLVSLYKLSWKETLNELRNPRVTSKDVNRKEEFLKVADDLEQCRHMLGIVVVIFPSEDFNAEKCKKIITNTYNYILRKEKCPRPQFAKSTYNEFGIMVGGIETTL